MFKLSSLAAVFSLARHYFGINKEFRALKINQKVIPMTCTDLDIKQGS